MKSTARIRLRLLGRLALTRGEGPAPIRLSTRKAGALLAYVAMSPEHAANREELAALLWGSSSDQQARQSLRQALALLRKELGSPNLLVSDLAVVQLQPGHWQVDARDFEDLSKSLDAKDLLRAARLFGGEFLSGLNIEEEGFDEWVRVQRQRMQLAAGRLCETFATRPDLVADGEEAVTAVECLLTLDPLREDWHRIALTLYARYRGRTEALAQAEAFSATLRRELGVSPEEETGKLVERIRRGEIVPASATAPAPENSVAESSHPVAVPVTRLPDPLEVQQPSAVVPPATPQSTVQKRWPYRGVAAALAVFSILTTAGFIGFAYQRTTVLPTAPVTAQPSPAETDYWRSPASSNQARIPRGIIPIAVLPFTVVGGTGESTQLIADMMTDDLITVLSRVPAFRVISRQTVNRFKSESMDIAAMGAELKVKYVLEGSLRAQETGLRVNLQLLDPATRLPVWSGRVEREGTDRHEVRDEIVGRIARELQIDILPIEVGRRAGDPGADALAYRGWAAMNAAFARSGTDAFKKAHDLFAQALEREPQHLSATIGLGAYHANVGAQVLDGESQAHLEKARTILLGVIERAPSDSSAPFYLGLVYGATGKLDDAIAAFTLAVERNPSHAGAHAHVGFAMARMGRAPEGLEHLQYAIRLSPRDPNLAYWLDFIGTANLSLENYKEAIENFQRSTSLNPGYPRSWAGLAAAHALSGDMDEARRHGDKLRTFAPQLDVDALIKRFGRNKQHAPRLYEGLRLALAPPETPWRSPAASSASGLVALVVLPFTNAGDGDERSTRIADMVTDDLTNILSRVGGLRVISRQTATSYRGQVDPVAVGAQLGVRYVLRGSLDLKASAFVADIALVDARTGQAVWSRQFQRNGNDRYAVQDDIVNGLGRELSFEIIRAESDHSSINPDVHELIFKGWSAIQDATASGLPSVIQAETYFAQALEREPNNTRALTGLATYHVLMAVQLFAPDPVPHLAKAEELLQPIIERNPAISEPYAVLGLLHIARKQSKEATQAFERAIELNPSHAPAYAQLGRLLTAKGRPAEGLDHIRYAMRLSPRDPSMAYWLGFAGAAQLELGTYAKAIEDLDRAVALHPTQPRTLLVLIAAHALQGNLDEARGRLARLQAALPHLTTEKLVERSFGATLSAMPRLKEGLRLALAPPTDAWQAPPSPLKPRAMAAEPAKAITAIAVLPFTTFGETAGAIQLIAETMTDDLTNMLSRVANIRVISRQTARGYQGQRMDIAAIGAELQVRYILEGSIRMHGDKLRVNVEMIDPGTRLPAWSARIERDSAERHSVQDEIVGRLARELHFEIYRAESERASKNPDLSELAYLGWTQILKHGTEGIEALTRAEATFTEILARDPDNWGGQQGLGAYHVLVGSLQLLPDWKDHMAKGETLLQQSIRAQPNNAPAYFYLSIVQRMRGELREAMESLGRCLEISPSHAPCHAHVGHTLVQMGRAGEGREHIRYAMRLGPRDQSRPHWLRFAGEAEIELGQFEQAVALLRESYSANPRQPRMLRSLAAALALSGNLDEARRYLAELTDAAPHSALGAPVKRPKELEGSQPELARGLRLAQAPNGREATPDNRKPNTTFLSPRAGEPQPH